MAKPSRIRKIAFILVAAPFVALLIAAVVAASVFLTFSDRWGEPTDFAAQHEALTRSHLGLSGDASAGTELWRSIIDDLTNAHAAHVAGFAAGRTPWPSELFGADANEADVATRDAILAELERDQIYARLDQLAGDPRVVLVPEAGRTLFDFGGVFMASRQLTRVLEFRIDQALERGDADAAIADLSRVVTIARVFQGTPTILSGLMNGATNNVAFRAAIRIAESPGIDPARLKAIASIVSGTGVSDVAYVIEGERLVSLEMITTRFRPSPLIPMDSRAQLRKIDEIYDTLVERSSRTIEERRGAPGSIGVSNRWNRLDRMLYPAAAITEPVLEKSLEVDDQIRMERSGTIIAVAIHRYRLDHAGELPATLDALVPTYLAELPIDPFSGKPPVYVKGPIEVPQSGTSKGAGKPTTTAAFMLYSVGYDGIDNAGVLGFDARDGLRSKGAGKDFVLYPRAE